MALFKRTRRVFEITRDGKQLIEVEKGGISYIFGEDTTIVDLRTNKQKPGVSIKKLVLDAGKASIAQIITAVPAVAAHELAHAGTAILVGARLGQIELLPPNAGVEVIIDATGAKMAIALVPTILEALLGLYLIRRGLKNKKAIIFSTGVMLSTFPLWRFIFINLISRGITDYSIFEHSLKQYLIDNRVADFDTIAYLDSNAIIFVALMAIYGGILLGSRYAPVILGKIKSAQKAFKELRAMQKEIKEFKKQGKLKGKIILLSRKKAHAILNSLKDIKITKELEVEK